MLGNAFRESQLNYARLIQIFCRKGLYLKMQKIHHKTLKVIYQSNKTYEELSELSETVSIYQRHLRFQLLKFTRLVVINEICQILQKKSDFAQSTETSFEIS